MAQWSLVNLGNTNWLHIRAPATEDIERLVALWTDPAVTEHIGGPRDAGLIAGEFGHYVADPAAFVESEHEWWWSVIECASGAFAGLCGLVEKDVDGQTETDLVYVFMPAFWGKGYATEAAGQVARYAFGEIGVESVIAIIDPRNGASAGVARKLGMRLEREALRPDGVTRQIYRLRRTPGQTAAGRQPA